MFYFRFLISMYLLEITWLHFNRCMDRHSRCWDGQDSSIYFTKWYHGWSGMTYTKQDRQNIVNPSFRYCQDIWDNLTQEKLDRYVRRRAEIQVLEMQEHWHSMNPICID